MKYLAIAPVLFLAACGSSSDAPGEVTAGEAKALDEAAEMLEAKQLSPSAIPPAPRGEPAAPASAAPAN
ncbi:hypothetical protein [Novosphingobium sp.]|uniref:hypothetical protein n=1 Tax=Novosphingobium sp. TaxID=1874826 RepID=UPI00286D9722|nr:hypothetical protein [Novosphingobium sp.]